MSMYLIMLYYIKLYLLPEEFDLPTSNRISVFSTRIKLLLSVKIKHQNKKKRFLEIRR